MRVLLVKMSSLGDVVHLLPAVTEAIACRPDLSFDWLVEEGFACIPGWHPGIATTVPVALRRWRRAPFAGRGEFAALRRQLGAGRYDLIVDAQGLLKSAFMARVAASAAGRQRPRVPVAGFAADSAREPLAAHAYSERHTVPIGEHAITRLRHLLALALGYQRGTGSADYGIRAPAPLAVPPFLLFAHATTWASKHWPVQFFRDLAGRAGRAGLCVRLPHGNDHEAARAAAIADGLPHVQVLPRMPLAELGLHLAAARAVVGVDSGLAHLAAAFGVPTVVACGPTDPHRTGVVGRRACNLAADGSQFGCVPCLARTCTYRGATQLAGDRAAPVQPACFASVTPARVWAALAAAQSPAP